MLLSELSFIDLLPKRFRDDKTVKGLAAVANYFLQLLLSKSVALPIWTRIDNQSEQVLDEMAVALNLKWYDRSANIVQKRAILISANKVYRQLGTTAAVEQVAKDYFGAAVVQEWWEYSGEPGHFRIIIQAQSLTAEQIEAFTRSIRWVKRASAVLDAITTEEPIHGTLYIGGAYHDIASDSLEA